MFSSQLAEQWTEYSKLQWYISSVTATYPNGHLCPIISETDRVNLGLAGGESEKTWDWSLVFLFQMCLAPQATEKQIWELINIIPTGSEMLALFGPKSSQALDGTGRFVYFFVAASYTDNYNI